VLTSSVPLAKLPVPNEIVATGAEGNLARHKVTHQLDLRISGECVGNSISVFADWHIENPSVGGFVTTANQGRHDVLLT
jgi:hypothetical protein